MILIYFTISFPYPKEPKEKISISLSALFLSTQKRQKNNSFFEVVSSNESGVWSRTSISGQGPRRGLSYSLRGGPELVVRAMRVPYFSDLLFCFFVCSWLLLIWFLTIITFPPIPPGQNPWKRERKIHRISSLTISSLRGLGWRLEKPLIRLPGSVFPFH